MALFYSLLFRSSLVSRKLRNSLLSAAGRDEGFLIFTHFAAGTSGQPLPAHKRPGPAAARPGGCRPGPRRNQSGERPPTGPGPRRTRRISGPGIPGASPGSSSLKFLMAGRVRLHSRVVGSQGAGVFVCELRSLLVLTCLGVAVSRVAGLPFSKTPGRKCCNMAALQCQRVVNLRHLRVAVATRCSITA